jgi:hypothetical protein
MVNGVLVIASDIVSFSGTTTNIEAGILCEIREARIVLLLQLRVCN